MNVRAPDSHGWVTVGLFALTVGVLGLMAYFPELRKDDLFKMIAQGIVLTALVNGPVAFYFGASKATPPAPPAPDPQPQQGPTP